MHNGLQALAIMNQLGFSCERCRVNPAIWQNGWNKVCTECKRDKEAAYEPLKQPKIAYRLSEIVTEWLYKSSGGEAVAGTCGAV